MRTLAALLFALACTAAAARRLFQQPGPEIPLRPDKPIATALPPVLVEAPLAQASCVA